MNEGNDKRPLLSAANIMQRDTHVSWIGDIQSSNVFQPCDISAVVIQAPLAHYQSICDALRGFDSCARFTEPTVTLVRSNENERVFIPKERIRVFDTKPFLNSVTLRLLTLRTTWAFIVFITLFVAEGMLVVGNLVHGSWFLPLYLSFLLCNAVILWATLTQYSRSLMLQCAMIFEFWYQVVLYLTAVTCDTIALSSSSATSSSATYFPRYFQTIALMLVVFGIDALRSTKQFKAVLLMFYGFILVFVFGMWRIKLRKIIEDPIDLGVTSIQLSALAEASLLTCGVFLVRYAVSMIIIGREMLFVKFELAEVHPSVASLLELCEFRVVLANEGSDGAVSRASVARFVMSQQERIKEIICGVSADACVTHLTFNGRATHRCFIPIYRSIVLNGKALIQSPIIKRVLRHQYFTFWPFIAVASVAMSNAVLWNSSSKVLFHVHCLLQFLLSIPMMLLISQHARGIYRELLRTFDFWYLCFNGAVLVVCTTYRYSVVLVDNPMMIMSSVGTSLLWIVLLMVMTATDASPLPLRTKGLLSIVFSLALFVEALGWRLFYVQVVSDEVIIVWDFSTSVGAMAQAAAMNLVAYSCRSAYNTLARRHQFVLLSFNAREVDSTHSAEERELVERGHALSTNRFLSAMWWPSPSRANIGQEA